MIILGIDPGTATTGYGIIESVSDNYRAAAFGVISTPKGMLLSERLRTISEELEKILRKFQIDQMAVERLFFVRNITTGIEVGHARGVILLAASQANLPVYQYTPLEVKQAVCGAGHASKDQVAAMTAKLLKLTDIPKPDDAADGLAVALTHAFRYPFAAKTGDESARI